MTQDLIDQLRGLLAKGVPETDSGWYVSDYTPSGLSLIGDGLCSGIFPIACEGPQAALIVATVNALPGLLDTIEVQARRIQALEKALKPFSSVGELLDLETEGFSDEDDLGLITEEGHLMDRFSVGEFRAARAALHIRDGE